MGVRINGATMIFDVRLAGAKDASERLLFRNLQFAGPAPPRRFAVHFQSSSDVRAPARRGTRSLARRQKSSSIACRPCWRRAILRRQS